MESHCHRVTQFSPLAPESDVAEEASAPGIVPSDSLLVLLSGEGRGGALLWLALALALALAEALALARPSAGTASGEADPLRDPLPLDPLALPGRCWAPCRG